MDGKTYSVALGVRPLMAESLKKSKLNDTENLASCSLDASIASVAPIQRSVVVFVRNDVVLHVAECQRISGPKKFGSSAKNDFFNTIGAKRPLHAMKAFPADRRGPSWRRFAGGHGNTDINAKSLSVFPGDNAAP
jgi:hypothetical protein